jgi:hypothetical protein
MNELFLATTDILLPLLAKKKALNETKHHHL